MTPKKVGQVLAILVMGFVGLSKDAVAVDLRLSDDSAATVIVKSVAIDYTPYGILFPKDIERDGIRVEQAGGKVTIKWSVINRLTTTPKTVPVEPSGTTVALIADITLTSGKMVKVRLVPFSYSGLFGKSDLGDFSIPFESIRSIEVIKP